VPRQLLRRISLFHPTQSAFVAMRNPGANSTIYTLSMKDKTRIAELTRIGYEVASTEAISSDGEALMTVDGHLMTYRDADRLIQGESIKDVLKQIGARTSIKV
jgi:hypothetical protein